MVCQSEASRRSLTLRRGLLCERRVKNVRAGDKESDSKRLEKTRRNARSAELERSTCKLIGVLIERMVSVVIASARGELTLLS